MPTGVNDLVSTALETSITIRELGLVDYLPVWRDMQAFTQQRNEHSADEIWLLQHPPVFTLGLNGKAEHIDRKSVV
mgnify:CR=1 FL=1